jgi:hypothetical protein
MGASLGNSYIWVTLLGTGAIQAVFDIRSGTTLMGGVSIRYAGRGPRSIEGTVSHHAGEASYVGLAQTGAGTTEIHPAFQRHRFSIAGSVNICETVFVPLCGEPGADPAAVYQIVDIQNANPYPVGLRIFGFARLAGYSPGQVQARYDPHVRALIARDCSDPAKARAFGVTQAPEAYETSFDYGQVYDPLNVRPLRNSTEAAGDILGCLQFDLTLSSGEGRRCAFISAVSGSGGDAVIDMCRNAAHFDGALDRTMAYLEDCLSQS